MRILTITNWYPPHHRGGYEINCADVMTRMVARGHDVVVLCSDERLPDVPDGSSSVVVRRELRMYWKADRPWSPPVRSQFEIEKANQATLDSTVANFRPDVVSVWHMAALSLNLLTTVPRLRIPAVYAICDAWPAYSLSMDPWARRFNRGVFTRAAGRFAEAFWHVPAVLPDLGTLGKACFVSAFLRDTVRDNARWSFPDADIVPSGIDRSELEGPSRDPCEDWRWKLAYLGRFDHRKGTDTLIRAMSSLPAEASLVMYGRGDDGERRRLETLARSVGVAARVAFGSLDRHELAGAYRAVDCVVFPSEWPEPFGLVPLEAMECGIPVAATGVGGSADFLEDGVNCVLFDAGDPGGLAAAVRRLAEDPSLRLRLIEGGHATAQAYDVDLMADAYEQHFAVATGTTSL